MAPLSDSCLTVLSVQKLYLFIHFLKLIKIMKTEINNLIARAAQQAAGMEDLRSEARRLVRQILRSVAEIIWVPAADVKKSMEEGDENAYFEALAELDTVVIFEKDEKPISQGTVIAVTEDADTGDIIVKVHDLYSKEERSVVIEDVIDPEVILDFARVVLFENA